jgi:hypothetical protein
MVGAIRTGADTEGNGLQLAGRFTPALAGCRSRRRSAASPAVNSTATCLAPRPRRPPTPTINALTLPFLSSSISVTLPIF